MVQWLSDNPYPLSTLWMEYDEVGKAFTHLQPMTRFKAGYLQLAATLSNYANYMLLYIPAHEKLNRSN